MLLGPLHELLCCTTRRLAVAVIRGQVVDGESEVVSIRETDGRLGPLIFALIALGVITIVGTVYFWWMTRPNRAKE